MVLIAECRYNELGQRITWRYDQIANETAASAELFFRMYDDRWRMAGTFWDRGSTRQESFVYHAAGNAGRGSLSYSDRVVVCDGDADTDGTLEERRCQGQTWLANVIAITKLNDNPRVISRFHRSFDEAVTYATAGVHFPGRARP